MGLVSGERLGALALVGMTLALVAVALVSGGTDTRGRRPSRAALGLDSGAAIALQLVCLDLAPDDTGVAPLLVGRAVTTAVASSR